MKQSYRIDFINNFTSLYKDAITKALNLGTWPGYFLTKKTETELIFDSEVFKSSSKGLEIGCGNSFQSALLASAVETMVSTDLYDYNNTTHTVGMNKASQLLNSLRVSNVKLISSNAGDLPFKDNYFDFVFSSSSLEHIVDKKTAVKEMRRVLKHGGDMILIVPTHMPSLYAFPHAFLYIIARSIKLLFKLNNVKIKSHITNYNDNNIEFNAQDKETSFRKRFFRNHPSFPLPEPHGAYKNIFDEIRSQFPGAWLDMVTNEGFQIKKAMPLCLFPWVLIEPFSTILAARIYSASKKFNMSLRNVKSLQYIGYLITIFAKKV